MSWNPDRPPVEYLERRLKYYKKRAGMIRTFLKEGPSDFQKRYFGSVKGFNNAMKAALERNLNRQKEFAEAISKLTCN